jgi:hypothetical protein
VVLVTPVLAVIGFRIGARFSLSAVVGWGGLAILVLLALIATWIWLKQFDLGGRDQGPALAAVNGIGSDDPAVPPVKVRVMVVSDKIVIVSFPGRQPVEMASIPVDDVTSIVWRSKRTFGERSAQVWLTSVSHSPISLQLSTPGNSGDLNDVRQTLRQFVPVGAMTSESLRARSVALWMLPSALAILAVFAMLGAAGAPPSAATAEGRPGAAVPPSTVPSSSEAPLSVVPAPSVSTSKGPTGAAFTASGSGGSSIGRDRGPANAEAPGYFPMTSPDRLPLAAGRPWGRPCAALSLQFDSTTVPMSIVSSAFSVVQDLEKHMPIDIVVSEGTLRRFFGPHSKFDQQPPEPWINGDYEQLPVTFGTTRAPGPGGSDADWLVSWQTYASEDGTSVTFNYVIGKIPSEIGASDVLARKAVRLLLARSFGLLYSNVPGSGLQRSFGHSEDGFSAADIHALRVFSGCGQG